jgi:hypothetical protein
MASCHIIHAEVEAQMFSTESPPLNVQHDFDDEYAPCNGGGRPKPGKPYRSSGFKNAQFRSDRPSIGRRVVRSVTLFVLAVVVGVGGTLACQSDRDEISQLFPPFGWLFPVSTTKASAPNVTTAGLQEQLKPVAIDLALVRRSMEQLASNQEQLARKQDEMAQNIATLQAAEQEVSQKVSAPPPTPKVSAPPPASKPVHVSPKPVQPPAQ